VSYTAKIKLARFLKRFSIVPLPDDAEVRFVIGDRELELLHVVCDMERRQWVVRLMEKEVPPSDAGRIQE
jgi:hypothetical protein